MPEFNKQLFFDPKIDIIGKEVPLAALEKTGNVLQERYDKAMDNETKIGAVAKKLKASSNSVDHKVADQILKTYQDKLATRAKDGKYFDMVWQTQQDALDVAGMYEGLSNRNKTISEYEKMIDLNPKINDPKVKEYLKNQFKQNVKASQFDTENNILQGLDVNAPNIVNDFDYGKWAMENAGQWKPDTFGGKNVKTISTKAGDKLPDGTISGGGLYKIIGNHVTEKVSKQEIMQGLNKMAQEHPELQATLQRDMQVYGLEATMAKLNQTFNAAADAHAYTRQLANEDSIIFDEQSTNNQLPNSRSTLDNLFLKPKLDNTQGTVNLNKVEEVNTKTDLLKGLTFDKNGKLETNTILNAFKNEGLRMLGDLAGTVGMEIPKTNEKDKIKDVIPPALYKTMKAKGASDKDMVLAYHNNLEKYKKVVNSEYTFLDPKTQETFDKQIRNGASGYNFIDTTPLIGGSKEVELTPAELSNATVKMIPGEGKYVVNVGSKQYIPKTIDPSVQGYLNQASELMYEFNDLSNTTNLVDIPLYDNGVKRTGKAVITKTDIRPDGTYKGKITLVTKGPDGKYVKLQDGINYDTKEQDSPVIINKLINNYLGAATASQGLYE